MSDLELIALALGASILTAAVGRGVAGLLDRRLGEARLRETAWAWALFAPLLPPVAVGLILLAPAPESEPIVMTASAPTETVAPVVAAAPVVETATAFALPDIGLLAPAVLLLAAGLIGFRAVRLAFRARRLARLLKTAEAAPSPVMDQVRREAERLGVRAPEARIGETGGDVLLAGVWRPVIVVPRNVDMDAAFPPVVRHELAHLKRRDHLTLWLEEAALTALAFNPLASGLRDRRSAAREEACDAVALEGASPQTRRAYAERLVETLKTTVGAPQPALAFGGRRIRKSGGDPKMKTPMMRRLGGILTPPAPSGRGGRALALGAGLSVLVAAALGSAAVASQRAATPALILTEDDASAGSQDWLWTEAALAPVYKAVWPGACGISRNQDGVSIHVGEGCAGAGVADARLTTVEGLDPARDSRGVFEAVKRACDAGRPVSLAWTENGAARSARAACSAVAVAPVAPKAIEIALTYEGVEAPRPGDRLEVMLERQQGENRHSKSLTFGLSAGSPLPTEVRGMASQALFADGGAPTLLVRVIGADGVTRARTVAQTKPMIVSADQVIAFADLKPVAAREGQAADVEAAVSSLTPDQRRRLEQATAADYKVMCLSGDPLDEGFCSGVMFAALDMSNSNQRVCAPTDADGQVDTLTATTRGKAVMATVAVRAGMTPRDVARAALATAWPCATTTTAEVRAGDAAVTLPVQLDVARLPAFTRGETLTVSLWSGEPGEPGLARVASRQMRADASGRLPIAVDMPLGSDLFPRFGQSARAYHLTAEIQAANGDRIYGVEPTTLRLAAMGQGAARRLRPELSFRRSGVAG